MKPKSVISAMLLVFVIGSVVYLGIKESRRWISPNPVAAKDQGIVAAASVSASATPKPQTGKIIAYYFHTTYRCPTCKRIEAYSKEAIEMGFPKELADGRLEFRLANIELPENEHFAQDYKLITKSLVLIRMKEGKPVEWTNLSRVWELNGSYDAFVRYVQQEIRTYLEKG